MNWVKKNYDRFLLAVFALALLACAGLLINNARGFSTVFAPLAEQKPQKSIVPGVQVDEVNKKQEKLVKPDLWSPRMVNERGLPVFVSVPMIAKDGKLIDPLGEGDTMLHPPVPNTWLIDNRQDLLSPNVLDQDSDGDGFTTLDEYSGEPKTDPMNKDSHPPYWTKMVMTQLRRIPFRLRFDAKNGDTILINVIDVEGAPTLFLKVNDLIKVTKPNYKVTKFEQKTSNAKGYPQDVSEVTVQNVESGESIVLPKGQEVDSPTSYAVINYQLTGKPFAVKKNQEFVLESEKAVKYKCLDLNDNSVTVLKENENKPIIIKLATVPPKK